MAVATQLYCQTVIGETSDGLVVEKRSSIMIQNSNAGERSGMDPLASEKIAVERKIFFLDLKENQRGRFLKITEDVGGRRDTIMLPAQAFKDFLEALQRLVEFESKLSESP